MTAMNAIAGRAAAVTFGIVLVACSSGKVGSGGNRVEAAQFNMQLAIDYFRQGDLNQAKEKLDRALEQDPRNAKTHSTAGFLYAQLREPDKAERHYERAVSLDPKDPEIRNNFSVFLCGQGKFARGEKQALEAIADPLYRTPELALYNAGLCAQGAKDDKRAENYFRRALAVQPRFAPALLEMAAVEYRTQNYLPARAFIERYMSAQRPPSPQALLLAVRIERALGNRATAGDYARTLLNEHPTSDETKALLEMDRVGG
jgi:type IV pilus assembly protein PilF